MHTRVVLISAALLGGGLHAQHSLVFCMDENEMTLDNGGGLAEAGLLREGETALVTPVAGYYSASVFQSLGAQWAFIGDADLDGELQDASTACPGAGTDVLFVKHFPAPQPGGGPRDVYLSKVDSTGLDPTLENGDVFRFAAQGAPEIFVTEAQLLDALGQASTADLNTDALCQADNGDLFVSFADAEVAPGGTADDGGLLRIPASAITYDASDNVAAIAVGSAELIAQEAEVNAWIAASGVLTSVGGAPSTSIDLTGLELDPAGGTFEAPLVPGLLLPNLLFAWNGFSNDGAVLSTAAGGSLASLNGVPLASDVATTGAQIGLLPDSTGLGGLMGIAVVDERPAQHASEVHPTGLITSSTILWSRQEVSGATPGGLVVVFADVGPSGAGAVLPVLLLPGLGELFSDGTVFVLATVAADALGYAGNVLTLPSTLVGSNLNLVFQSFDIGTFAFGTPAPIQFL